MVGDVKTPLEGLAASQTSVQRRFTAIVMPDADQLAWERSGIVPRWLASRSRHRTKNGGRS